jgi:hypothetical protein
VVIYVRKRNLTHRDNLYAEAIEAVKTRAALSTSSSELISILAILNQRQGFQTIPSLRIFQLIPKVLRFNVTQYAE